MKKKIEKEVEVRNGIYKNFRERKMEMNILVILEDK